MKTKKLNANRPIDPPDLPRATSLAAINIDRLTADSYELVKIEGGMLQDTSSSGLRFDSCVLTRIGLDRSTLSNLKMIDVRVERSSAANGVWANPSLRRIEVVDSRLTGLTVTEGKLSDVLFRECKADFLQLASSRTRNVHFENCTLAEADFHDSKIERVTFNGCDLRKADLSRATLSEVDLRGSNIEGLVIEAAQLGSLTIDPSQAMVILQTLGANFG